MNIHVFMMKVLTSVIRNGRKKAEKHLGYDVKQLLSTDAS